MAIAGNKLAYAALKKHGSGYNKWGEAQRN